MNHNRNVLFFFGTLFQDIKFQESTHVFSAIRISNSPPSHNIIFQAYACLGSRLICNKCFLFHICLRVKWVWVNAHYIGNLDHVHLQTSTKISPQENMCRHEHSLSIRCNKTTKQLLPLSTLQNTMSV